MKEQVAGRTGASWEDRLQEQKAKKVQAMKMIEKEPINRQFWDLPMIYLSGLRSL